MSTNDIVCRKCNEVKPPTEFYKGHKRCKRCHCAETTQWTNAHRDFLRVHNRERQTKRRLALIDNRPCEKCGLRDPVLLHFAHRDRKTKKAGIATLVGRGTFKAAKDEADKCKILCARCHRLETHAEDNTYMHRYVTTGCMPLPGETRRRQRTFIVNYMKDKKCLECGEADMRVLENDHIDPKTKVSSVSWMVSHHATVGDIGREVAKCQVLCVLCHLMKTHNDRQRAVLLRAKEAEERRERATSIVSIVLPRTDCMPLQPG